MEIHVEDIPTTGILDTFPLICPLEVKAFLTNSLPRHRHLHFRSL